MTRHLLGALDLNEWELRLLLDRAASLAGDAGATAAERPLAGRLVALGADGPVPPVREAAARRLGADTVAVPLESVGSIEVMATGLDALAPDLAVLSHSLAGMPSRVARRLRCPVVGAGDGARENLPHALAAALALREALGDVQGRHVALMGDVLHSGLARSTLIVLGALGARLRLVVPSVLLPPGAEGMGATIHTDADEGVRGADAIIVLPSPTRGEGSLAYTHAPTPERLALASPDAVLIDRTGLAASDPGCTIDPSARDLPVLMAMMLTALGIEL